MMEENIDRILDNTEDLRGVESKGGGFSLSCSILSSVFQRIWDSKQLLVSPCTNNADIKESRRSSAFVNG